MRTLALLPSPPASTSGASFGRTNSTPSTNSSIGYSVAQHTVEFVFHALTSRSVGLLSEPGLAAEIVSACDLFTGYLLFDAWVGNTDRHHENWAVLRLADGRHVLAPSFDHASSLGHNIQDAARSERLTTRDRNRSVATFAAKAKSAIYRTATESKPVTTDEAFRLASAIAPQAGSHWLGRLGAIDDAAPTDIVRRVPAEIMSEVAKQFTLGMLRANRARLHNNNE